MLVATTDGFSHNAAQPTWAAGSENLLGTPVDPVMISHEVGLANGQR